VGEHGDRALMTFLARIRVEKFMQRRRRGEQVQQQNQGHGKDSKDNPATPHQVVFSKRQSAGNLAEEQPVASLISIKTVPVGKHKIRTAAAIATAADC
jgi:hypothetical protein